MSTVKVYKASEAANRDPNQITLTENARRHLAKIVAKQGHGIGLRLSVTKTGCSGYGYVVDLIDEANPDDHISPLSNNLVVAVAPEHFKLLKGTKIDFVKKGLNEMFVYKNPNQTGECGCGESFSVAPKHGSDDSTL